MCRSCDADKPAASALLRFFGEGSGRNTTRGGTGTAAERARLLMEWAKEGMAEHGWVQPDLPDPHP
ncbi:DUF6300 family protein [Streptomyces cinnamoneus]|uniref:DUF6300 family protein n=1 Tax=Streptomyces cinnamoneus TaxID=53446 RepID=UPI0034185132